MYSMLSHYRVQEEAENWFLDRITVNPQTFGELEEIKVVTMKMQCKNQFCVTIVCLSTT